MASEEEVPLKYQKIEPFALLRGDVILHEGGLWQCALKNAFIFLNLQSKEQREIRLEWYLRVRKLQLIPLEWKVVEGKVSLKGQELGLGQVHQIEIEGMRKFQEMDIVRSQAEKGRTVHYKVIVLETEVRPKYFLVAVEFL